MKCRRKGYLILLLAVIMAFVFVINNASAAEKTMRINVGLKLRHTLNKVRDELETHAGKEVQEMQAINVVTFNIPEKVFAKVRAHLLKEGMAVFVERDMIRSIPTPPAPSDAGTIPGDPLYKDQWGPACVGAEEAWDYPLLYDHPEVIVAVVDTGVDLYHPDLLSQVDTSIDYDFVNNDDEAMDDNGHGTHCAGIIGAAIDNGTGIAGLQNVTIMAVKGLNSRGSGFDSVLAQCIIYAVDNGAKVISNSWTGYGSSRTLEAATYYAFTNGAVVLAAAGNEGWSVPAVPASYPWVVGVAALKDCDTRASYSNYGQKNVFVAAPGSDIYSTYAGESYVYLSGTSMACPHVAGAAAMWMGAVPGLTPLQVMYLLGATADDLGDPGKDDYYGWGRVDMFPWAD